MLNINVGVLGHVDCGKTSLVAALSTTLSTAALDKHPQSRERGITLDLGFSAFTVPPPPAVQQAGFSSLQFTLVDCPGHASLIRTIIGGAQIIDTMVLVVDVTKGIQAQTAECLVVGEIAARDMVVALNKIDQLPEAVRAKAVKKATRLLHDTLAATKFGKVPVIPVAAKPEPLGIEELKAWLVASVEQQQLRQQQERQQQQLQLPPPPQQQQQQERQKQQPQQQQQQQPKQQQRQPQQQRQHQQQQQAPQGASSSSTRGAAAAAQPFLFAIDHCFQIKGQGTVLTGTVLQGACKVGDTLELPALKLSRQVKSMQLFRRPVQSVARGDRAGLCVTQLNPQLIERGLAAAPGSVPTFAAALALVDKVRFYAGAVPGPAKYHISIGHATVMAEATFFGLPDGQGVSQAESLRQAISFLNSTAQHAPLPPFDWAREYLAQQELHGLEGRPPRAGGAAAGARQRPHFGQQWALLRFEQPLSAPEDSIIIGARLDVEGCGDSCRLAFYGRLLASLGQGGPDELRRLRVYKLKERRGGIDRISPDGCSAICKGLFKRESDISFFEGARVVTGRGEQGRIEGRFGTTGKFRVQFDYPGLQLPPPGAGAADAGGSAGGDASPSGSSGGGGKGKGGGGGLRGRSPESNAIYLRHKRFIFHPDAKHKLQQ